MHEGIIIPVDDIKRHIDDLAELMDEFSLSEASLAGDGWRVAFKKPGRKAPSKQSSETETEDESYAAPTPAMGPAAPVEQGPKGIPVSSPMNGIFYSSPSPSAPSFVKEGEAVTAGQVVGLIEAMKVFNEIVAPTTGIVDRIVAENGALVQPGEPLLYIA